MGKHTDRSIANLGLEILLEFLGQVEKQPTIAQEIYKAYYIPVLKDILYVLTDRLHKSQFHLQTLVLRHLCRLVEVGATSAPLWDPRTDSDIQSNQQYVRVYIAKLLSGAFSN